MHHEKKITDPQALVGMRVTVAEKSPDAPNRTFVGFVREFVASGPSLILDSVQELHFIGEEGGPTETIEHAHKVIPLTEFDVLLCMEPL